MTDYNYYSWTQAKGLGEHYKSAFGEHVNVVVQIANGGRQYYSGRLTETSYGSETVNGENLAGIILTVGPDEMPLEVWIPYQIIVEWTLAGT